MNRDFQYIADTILIENVFRERSVHYKTAEGDSLLNSLSSGIIEYVKSQYDPKRPVESVLTFFGPVMLSAIGAPWLALLYELAGALGFDWLGFWQNVKEAIKPELQKAEATGKEDFDHSKIDNAVDGAMQANFKPKEDAAGVFNIIKEYAGKIHLPDLKESIDDALLLKKVANRYLEIHGGVPRIIKTSGILSKLAIKLFPFFKSVFSWIIKTGLKALGYGAVGGVVSTFTGTLEKKKEQAEGDGGGLADKKKIKLIQNKNINPAYLTRHPNDSRSYWTENYSIDDIEDLLMNWSHDIYPQLNSKDAFEASPVFDKIIKAFKKKNQGPQSLKIISIPPPFESILDIVNSFAADVAARSS